MSSHRNNIIMHQFSMLLVSAHFHNFIIIRICHKWLQSKWYGFMFSSCLLLNHYNGLVLKSDHSHILGGIFEILHLGQRGCRWLTMAWSRCKSLGTVQNHQCYFLSANSRQGRTHPPSPKLSAILVFCDRKKCWKTLM